MDPTRQKTGKILFWNVDTQYDFMRNDNSFKGALPVANARAIEQNLEKLTSIAEKYDIQVINTADWHTINDDELSSTPDFKNTYPMHCMKNTFGARYVPATSPKDPYVISWEDDGFDAKKVQYSRNIVLYKNKFDIFEGNAYANDVLKILNPNIVIVYGVATNVCVDLAVRGLKNRFREVFVVLDAVKELPKEVSAKPLENILNEWGSSVEKTNTNEVEYLISHPEYIATFG